MTEEELCWIGALYEIEEQICGKPPDERRNLRHGRAVSLLDNLKLWFGATLATYSPKSQTTKAIRCALKH